MAQPVKNPPAMRETWVRSLGLGRSPGEEKGSPLQYSGLENSMDCIVHGVTKSWTRLGDVHFTQTHTHTHIYIYMYINNYYPRKMFAFYKNGKILIVKVVNI